MCQKHEKDDKLLVTILTTADFGGYCSKSENFNMSLQILNNIPNFYNFLLTQAIAKDYEDSNKLPLFQFNSSISEIFSTPSKS